MGKLVLLGFCGFILYIVVGVVQGMRLMQVLE